MSLNQSGGSYAWRVFNGLKPLKEGRSLSYVADFTSVSSIDLNLTHQRDELKIEWIQGLFVDNSLNGTNFFITCLQSNHTLNVPPNWQAFLPLLAPSTHFLLQTSGGVRVPLQLYTMALPAFGWSVNVASSGGGAVAGPVTETIVAVPSGVSTTILAASSVSKYLNIQNMNSASFGLSLSGQTLSGTAPAVGNVGQTLYGGGAYQNPANYIPNGAVTAYQNSGSTLDLYVAYA